MRPPAMPLVRVTRAPLLSTVTRMASLFLSPVCPATPSCRGSGGSLVSPLAHRLMRAPLPSLLIGGC